MLKRRYFASRQKSVKPLSFIPSDPRGVPRPVDCWLADLSACAGQPADIRAGSAGWRVAGPSAGVSDRVWAPLWDGDGKHAPPVLYGSLGRYAGRPGDWAAITGGADTKCGSDQTAAALAATAASSSPAPAELLPAAPGAVDRADGTGAGGMSGWTLPVAGEPGKRRGRPGVAGAGGSPGATACHGAAVARAGGSMWLRAAVARGSSDWAVASSRSGSTYPGSAADAKAECAALPGARSEPCAQSPARCRHSLPAVSSPFSACCLFVGSVRFR